MEVCYVRCRFRFELFGAMLDFRPVQPEMRHGPKRTQRGSLIVLDCVFKRVFARPFRFGRIGDPVIGVLIGSPYRAGVA